MIQTILDKIVREINLPTCLTDPNLASCSFAYKLTVEDLKYQWVIIAEHSKILFWAMDIKNITVALFQDQISKDYLLNIVGYKE
jgi:hypothetical protein